MTHEYSILTGGVIDGAPASSPPTAIAWAADTVLAVGGDDEILAISRGDSHVAGLRGATVRPFGETLLEAGAPADFEVLDRGSAAVIAVVRAGRVVWGEIPDLELD